MSFYELTAWSLIGPGAGIRLSRANDFLPCLFVCFLIGDQRETQNSLLLVVGCVKCKTTGNHV